MLFVLRRRSRASREGARSGRARLHALRAASAPARAGQCRGHLRRKDARLPANRLPIYSEKEIQKALRCVEFAFVIGAGEFALEWSYILLHVQVYSYINFLFPFSLQLDNGRLRTSE